MLRHDADRPHPFAGVLQSDRQGSIDGVTPRVHSRKMAPRAQDESLEDSGELSKPQDLATETITELEAAADDLREIVTLVEKEEGMAK